MKEVTGNLITLGKKGVFDVIVHGCNCFHTMNSGIAKEMRTTFPEAFQADLQQTNYGDKAKLGTYSLVKVGGLTIINAYTQYRYGGSTPNVDYDAIRNCFRAIKKDFSGTRIGYPLIGAGYAGGDWNRIAPITETELAGEDHTLVRFGQ